MTALKTIKASSLLLATVLSAPGAMADVRPAALFTDNMVIQQQANAAVWGWADVGEKVTVSASWGESASAVAGSDGKWSLTLKTPAAKNNSSASYSLSFKGKNQIDVKDVLVGEVWLASGQSNMAFLISKLKLSEEQLGESDQPLVREYTVLRNASKTPVSDAKGRWYKASSETIADFAGTAYFFARYLHKNIEVPVGIINSSWGGSPIESWLTRDSQKNHKATQEMMAVRDKLLNSFDAVASKKKNATAVARWQKAKAAAMKSNTKFKAPKPRERTPDLLKHKYPGVLYDGMIHPLKPYTVKGVIWYQGESNSNSVERALFYETQLKMLITDWREDFENADLPFYVAQLAAFRAHQVNPVEHKQYWAITREGIRKATSSLDHADMAVAIDIGDAGNIHPQNKMEIGRRLALLALHHDYGHDVVPAGPLYKNFTIEGSNILIDFYHNGSGLMVKDGTTLKGFAVAGEDGKYVWADAKIITKAGKQLVEVHSDLVAKPQSVRYGWADNPDTINLYNKEGLPASPFSTN